MQAAETFDAGRLADSGVLMAYFFGLGGVGGVLRGLNRRLPKGEVLVSGGTSGFAGVMAGLIAGWFWREPEDWPLVLACVGLVAWIGGTVFLDMVGEQFRGVVADKLAACITVLTSVSATGRRTTTTTATAVAATTTTTVTPPVTNARPALGGGGGGLSIDTR